ncbi:hypothetical protein SDC9_139499 [bioreactor metagenome]|uniref:Uncharacterized protein n=1 Tax=bioreactor metagenome TaxID=1076179 RepID=A0A645DSA8_9ZZZZ
MFASISEKNATFAKIISENIFLQIKNCTFAVLNLKVKTRKNFTLEIVEQCTNVTIYSILFENEENNEFIKFITKYANNPSFSRDIQRIVSYIDKIKEKGALERYFRREGKPGQKIKAIPVEINKLRLYAIRLTDNILILGNGGHKKTKTYNVDPELNGYVEHLAQLSFILQLKLETGVIKINQNELNGDLSFYFKEELI